MQNKPPKTHRENTQAFYQNWEPWEKLMQLLKHAKMDKPSVSETFKVIQS